MSWPRVLTILRYAWYHLTHSMETWVDIVWFPFIELLVFGVFANVFVPTQPQIVATVITGLIFWEILRAVQYSLTVAMLWDVWSRCFSTMFVSPLTMSEFVVGQVLGGIGKGVLVMLVLATFSLFFHVNFFALGPVLVIYFGILALIAAFLGLFAMALIIRFGTDIQSLAWSLIFVLQPISAVFYPVEALPASLRQLAYFSPITYLMESARHQILVGDVRWQYLGWSLGLTLIYGCLIVLFFNYLYRRAKRTGSFARMDM